MKQGSYRLSTKRYEYEAAYESAADTLAPYFDPLWLDVVCGKEGWNPMVVEFENGHKLLFPYYCPVKNHLSQPPYTQFLGPHIISSDRKKLVFSDYRNALLVLAESIPEMKSYYFQVSPQLKDWLPFRWKGFEQTTRYTNILVLENPDVVELSSRCNQLLRRKVRAAEKEGFKLVEGGSPHELLSLVDASLIRSSGKSSNYKERFIKLAEVMKQAGKGEIYLAKRNGSQNAEAAVFMVRTKDRTYYMAGGQDLSSGKNALAFCLYNAIAAEIGRFGVKEVDFEGSMIKGVEFFFRNFGAEQVPYFAIFKSKIGLLGRLKRKYNTK